MAANPPLCAWQGATWPQPYAGEQILLSRGGVQLDLRGAPLRTRGSKWAARGTIFLTSMRLVFVADKADASGLQAFELPLAYISEEDFRQPIFTANNLSGRCAMVEGGPAGGDSVAWVLYFREGGVGTFIPLFFRSCAYVRSIANSMQQAAQQAAQQAGANPGYPPPATAADGGAGAQQFLQTALVDPSDPTKIYLTQPLDSSQQRQDAPKFPAPLV